MISLSPTMSGRICGGGVDVASVLGMLATCGASGTFRLASGWLRLSSGVIVEASSGDAVAVARDMMRARSGDWGFRAVVGVPSGSVRLSVVGVLLEAARMMDESGAEVRA